MDSQFVNLFTLKKYNVINSSLTNMIYLNAQNECFFMESSIEAKQFCEINKNTYLLDAQYYKNIQIYINTLYQLGVETINIKQKGEKNFTKYHIDKEDLKSNIYFNHTVNQCLLQLQQTGQKRWLQKMHGEVFITPILLVARVEAQYPTIKYSIVKRDGKQYNILFSTLQEFDEWNSAQISKYGPLEVDLTKFERIRDTRSVIVNPLSNRLILDNNAIKIIKEGRKK